MKDISEIKIGVLGGGQLGLMLFEAAQEMGIGLNFLEKDAQFPATKKCDQFTAGDFKKYEDVLNFGKTLDVITIEIESVNTDALRELQKLGKVVIPQPDVIDLIKDKGDQKEFYVLNEIPTSAFIFSEDAQSIRDGIKDGSVTFPFVQKARRDGYDGKGVVVINSVTDLDKLFDVPSIIEEKIDILKEIAVIVFRDQDGKTGSFPSVEMTFHPTANLVENLFSPSTISEAQEETCKKIASDIINGMGMIGILAVELFITRNGEILVNEVAPRPHNSGHHTIEANITSQYQQLLNILAHRKLTSTAIKKPAVMINLLGEENHTGLARYQGLEEVSKIDGVHVHVYGKEITKPKRKMGHVTIVGDDLVTAMERANFVGNTLKVIT